MTDAGKDTTTTDQNTEGETPESILENPAINAPHSDAMESSSSWQNVNNPSDPKNTENAKTHNPLTRNINHEWNPFANGFAQPRAPTPPINETRPPTCPYISDDSNKENRFPQTAQINPKWVPYIKRAYHDCQDFATIAKWPKLIVHHVFPSFEVDVLYDKER